MQAELCFRAQAQLGEGPVWDERVNCLYWVDIMAGDLHSFCPATQQNRTWQLGQPVGTAVLRQSGGLVLALRDGFAFFDTDRGMLTPIADPEAHLPGNRFNDGRCDANGRFWAGTMALTMARGAGALYRIDPDLAVHTMLTGVTISNGIAWSQDQRTMYYVDTAPRTVTAFAFDAETGWMGNGRVILRIPASMGYPDGMTIDRDGKLWIAHYDGGCVRRWDPETGKVLTAVQVAASKVTACTFGGPDLNILYITTAVQEMSAAQRAAEPLAGSLFARQMPYQGFPANRFAG